MFETLNIIGAVGTIFMGCIGLFAPKRASALVGLEATTEAGRSEFRASYGGLFVALGLVPLVTMAPAAFAVAGTAWLLTGVGRIVSILVDRASTPTNWAGVAFEAVLGVLLLVGTPGLYLLNSL